MKRDPVFPGQLKPPDPARFSFLQNCWSGFSDVGLIFSIWYSVCGLSVKKLKITPFEIIQVMETRIPGSFRVVTVYQDPFNDRSCVPHCMDKFFLGEFN